MATALWAGIPVYISGRWEVDVTVHHVDREGNIETDRAIDLSAVVYGMSAAAAKQRAKAVAEVLA